MDKGSTTKFSRMSPRKIRPLARMCVRLGVVEADNRLGVINEKAARFLRAAIKTAVSDAVNNFKKSQDRLVIDSIQILDGPKMKRFRPVSRGTAHAYKRRMSHIMIHLAEKTETKVEPQKTSIKNEPDKKAVKKETKTNS